MYQGTLAPVSNCATWSESVEIYDDDDNSLIDLSAATEILFEVSDHHCTILKAALSEGTLTLEQSLGTFSFVFTPQQMKVLCARTYNVGCTIAVAGETIQVIAAYLPVYDGKVR